MARHNEAVANQLLEALRRRADPATTREVEGKQVADVIPQDKVSFPNEFSDALGIAHGTVSILLGALVKAGLLEGGQPNRRISTRWVALQGSYKNP